MILVADMPGVAKENLQLGVDNDELTISGLFPEPDAAGKKLVSECLYGNYTMTFTLSDVIAQDKIIAKLEDSVLTVILLKNKRVKQRKITIETE